MTEKIIASVGSCGLYPSTSYLCLCLTRITVYKQINIRSTCIRFSYRVRNWGFEPDLNADISSKADYGHTFMQRNRVTDPLRPRKGT